MPVKVTGLLFLTSKLSELKEGNIGIVEKAQETSFGVSQVADTLGYHLRIMFCVLCDC